MPSHPRRQNLQARQALGVQTLQSSFSTLFDDGGFTDRELDHFRGIGSGGGSCTHGGRAYEARLNLILPAVKWWSRWVTLPHQLACRASALLVCHDPMKVGRPPRCCPERTEFWRLGRASWRAAYVDIGAVVGNRTRTCSVAGSHSAVKSQPRKLKGPKASLRFRPMPFQ
jgi:hypothetical protein